MKSLEKSRGNVMEVTARDSFCPQGKRREEGPRNQEETMTVVPEPSQVTGLKGPVLTLHSLPSGHQSLAPLELLKPCMIPLRFSRLSSSVKGTVLHPFIPARGSSKTTFSFPPQLLHFLKIPGVPPLLSKLSPVSAPGVLTSFKK